MSRSAIQWAQSLAQLISVIELSYEYFIISCKIVRILSRHNHSTGSIQFNIEVVVSVVDLFVQCEQCVQFVRSFCGVCTDGWFSHQPAISGILSLKRQNIGLRITRKKACLVIEEWVQGVEGGNALADEDQVRENNQNQQEPVNSDWFHSLKNTTSTWWRQLLGEDATQVLSETSGSWTIFISIYRLLVLTLLLVVPGWPNSIPVAALADEDQVKLYHTWGYEEDNWFCTVRGPCSLLGQASWEQRREKCTHVQKKQTGCLRPPQG